MTLYDLSWIKTGQSLATSFGVARESGWNQRQRDRPASTRSASSPGSPGSPSTRSAPGSGATAPSSPARDDRGRLYDDVDLQKLKLLRRLVERGHAIGRIANLGEPELGKLLEAGLEPTDRDGKADAVDLEGLLEAVDRYDLAAVDRKLGKLSAVLSSREMVHEVVLPFMREVGKGWQEGRFTVAQEHMVSASLRNLLGSLVRVQAPRDGRTGLVFATPPGERHELGITAAAMLAAAGGPGSRLPGRRPARRRTSSRRSGGPEPGRWCSR